MTETVTPPPAAPEIHHPWDKPPELRPVVPGWLRDSETRTHAARWAARHAGHHTAFHFARLPKYGVRTLACAPRGLVRGSWSWWRWAFDRDDAGTHDLRVDAAARRDHKAYATAARIRKDRVRNRLTVSAGTVAAGALLAAITGLVWTPGLYVLAGALVALCGWLGRPAAGSLIDHAVVGAGAERVTADLIVRSLGNLGLAAINAALKASPSHAIQFIAPGVGRDGPGWRVELDLPHGVTVTDIMERRDRLAANLRRPLACVWPLQGEAHPGRLLLFILDRPLRDMPLAAWPLAERGTGDLFAPAPFGRDQRSRPVAVLLMFAGVLVGAMPRMGKTMALRILTLFAALDVRAELRVWELKGTGDLSAAEHFAHSYGSGADDATLADCLDDVRAVFNELDRRAAVIRGLPRDICPENKVTPELAGQRSLGLHPLVLVISECQEAFSHPSLGKEFDRLVTAIVKRGPALAVIPLLDTQRPDAASLPGGIRANIGIRFCLRVMDQTANDMVLPTSSYQNGYRATEFAAADKGVGWLTGHGDAFEIVRTYYCDAVAADAIGRRARRLREAAGTLSGYALGDREAAAPQVDLLADVLAVTEGTDRVWLETLATRLADLRPGIYHGWGAREAGEALRLRGVPVSQLWLTGQDGQSANRNGITRQAVLSASAGSSNPREASRS